MIDFQAILLRLPGLFKTLIMCVSEENNILINVLFKFGDLCLEIES